MATEIKKLSYFPLDTQFFENEKIEMLMPWAIRRLSALINC